MPADDRMPQEVEPQSTARGVALAVGLAVAVLTLLNAAMAVHLSSNEIDLVSKKWELLQRQQEPVDWLFLGDSSCNQGLDPKTWAKLDRGTSLNLCTNAYVTVANSAWMLKDWTDKHGPPKGIVVVHTFDTWARQFETSQLVSYPFDWGFWTTRQPPLDLSVAQQRDLLLLEFVPMLSRSGRLSNLKSLRANDKDGEKRERALNPGTFVRADGFMPWPTADPDGVARDTVELTEFLTNEPFVLSDLNAAALAKLGEYADAHRVPVYMTHAPLFEGVAELEVYRQYKAKIDAALDAFAAKHPHVTHVSEVYTTDADHLMIVDHITTDAAVDYTRWTSARTPSPR